MAAQAKLMAALRKDGDDAPRPEGLAPAEPSADRDTLKLRKSTLVNAPTWEAALEKLALNNRHDFTALHETVQKMLNNILVSPSEQKFRKIRHANPNFAAKVYSLKGGPEIFELAGFKKDSIEAGFLILPETAELLHLQKAIDALQTHAAERAASEEKKRKLEAESARKAREARAQKAAEAQAPDDYDAAVAHHSSQMIDEDEAMIEAIEAYVAAHPEINTTGKAFDSYDIERQVAGPGGSVVASVAASAGTAYFELACHMKRSDGGVWAVSRVEMVT